MKILMFHGTDSWEDIQKEGILWGKRNAPSQHTPSRCTYLADKPEEAARYGSVVLAVGFRPQEDVPNNWNPGAWQCRVYAPIPLDRVKVDLSEQQRETILCQCLEENSKPNLRYLGFLMASPLWPGGAEAVRQIECGCVFVYDEKETSP
jgi:hypothetical protein